MMGKFREAENFSAAEPTISSEDKSAQEAQKFSENKTINDVLASLDNLVAIKKARGGDISLDDTLDYLNEMLNDANETAKPFVQDTIDFVSMFKTQAKEVKQDVHSKEKGSESQDKIDKKMFGLLEKLYGNEETAENLLKRVEKIEQDIQKNIKDNKNRIDALKELLGVFSKATPVEWSIFPTIRKWDNLLEVGDVCGELKNNFSEIQKSKNSKKISIVAIEKMESIINKNVIDWEVETQSFMTVVNDYLKKNDNNLDEDTERKLAAFISSVGLRQIKPGKGSSLTSKEHHVNEMVDIPELKRGQIVRVIKRGIASGDRVLHRAVVDIAK